MMIFMKNKVFQPTLIRYSVTAITSRFHRGDRGSTPRIGVFCRKLRKFFPVKLL